MTILERVAAFAVAELPAELSVDITTDVQRRVYDLVGVSLAAVGSDPARTVQAVLTSWGGRPEAGLIGGTERYPAAAAALYNGTLAHALDFDDTHMPSVLHPSSSVIPAALAVAEATGASGAKLVRAIAVGDELCVRLGMAGYDPEARNSIFFDRGLHATAICGTVGAAAAAGILFGLDETRLAHAMSISASMGAGLLEANRTGGSVKRVHCGWAAHAGVTAAQLAREGLTGPPTVFEGRFGFLQAFCGDRADPEAIVRGLGSHWELLRLHFKPYPANHFTHAGIDAALELRSVGVRPQDVESVRLGVPAAVLKTIAEPAAEKARPSSAYNARFSGPFTFALALRGGGGLGVTVDDFTDAAVADPELLDLAARVSCVPDPECDAIFPNALPAIVDLLTREGKRHNVRVLENRGGPQRPLSDAELSLKFRINAARTLNDDQLTLLGAAISRLGELDDVRRVTLLSAPERSATETSAT